LAHAFANPLPEPSFAAAEESIPDVAEPSEEEPSAGMAGLGGQASTSAGFHFMQESELDNAGLADSQEWVDVHQNQVSESGVAAVTAETPHGEGVTADQTAAVAQQPEVMGLVLLSSGPSFDYRFAGTVIGFWKL
jgi:hypothetical protein